MKRNQAGFTLIELIMVIVILGILSAFALPRFADFGDNASDASIQGARGAVQSASGIVRSSALVNGETGATGTVEIEGVTIDLVEGYAAAVGSSNDDITGAAQIDGDFTVTEFTDTSAASLNSVTLGRQAIVVTLDPVDELEDGDLCFIYQQADSDFSPYISGIGSITVDGTPEITACSGDAVDDTELANAAP